MNDKAYLGVGLKQPLSLVNGKAALASGEDLIKQSIFVILGTPVGDRFMLPEFGSRVEELIFEQNDLVLQQMLKLFISDAIQTWEKRIKYLDTTFSFEDTTVYCQIKYRILTSNEIDSYIYPFYRQLKY